MEYSVPLAWNVSSAGWTSVAVPANAAKLSNSVSKPAKGFAALPKRPLVTMIAFDVNNEAEQPSLSTFPESHPTWTMSQARRYTMHTGRWPGNLAAYTPEGKLVTREPSIFLLQATYRDDAAASEPASIFSALRVPSRNQDYRMFFDEETLDDPFGLSKQGLTFGIHGEYDFGSTVLAKGKWAFVELGLVASEVGKYTEPMQTRVRSVFSYSMPPGTSTEEAEANWGKLRSIQVLRETRDPCRLEAVAEELKQDPTSSTIRPEVGSSDFVDQLPADNLVHCRNLQEYYQALEGTWRGFGEQLIVGSDCSILSVPVEYERMIHYDAGKNQAHVDTSLVMKDGSRTKLSASTAIVVPTNENMAHTEDGIQHILTGAGAIVHTIPKQIDLGKKHSFETAWLRVPSELRRVKRNFDEQGAWSASMYLVERKVE